MTIVPTSMSCRSRRRSLKRAKLQNSSASRVTAAHVGFFILNQSGKRPNGKRNPSLRDDAFKTHFASVREDGRAVAFDMLVEPDAGTGLGQDRCERGLADLKRITPQVVAIQLDEVEGV